MNENGKNYIKYSFKEKLNTWGNSFFNVLLPYKKEFDNIWTKMKQEIKDTVLFVSKQHKKKKEITHTRTHERWA